MKKPEKNAQALEQELAALSKMSLPELCRRHEELFGASTRSRHRLFLLRETAWKLQALQEGGLPEEVRQYALAIARNAPLRIRVVKNARRRQRGLPANDTIATSTLTSGYDSRLPLPGSLLIKDFKKQTHVVKVLDDAFEYAGIRYRSLSGIAHAITGTKWNGYLFFGLGKEKEVGG